MERNLKTSEASFLHRHTDIFNDSNTKNKIYRHLNDINDVISEDDIRNIKVSLPGSENILFKTNSKVERSLTPWGILDA